MGSVVTNILVCSTSWNICARYEGACCIADVVVTMASYWVEIEMSITCRSKKGSQDHHVHWVVTLSALLFQEELLDLTNIS